ncbi:MAG: hypothetical protein WC457_00610 [Patescibacteria group bacterium]
MLTNKKFMAALAIAVVVLIGLFMWFGWRPMHIRQNCFDQAKGDPRNDANKPGQERRNTVNALYDNCLNNAGVGR